MKSHASNRSFVALALAAAVLFCAGCRKDIPNEPKAATSTEEGRSTPATSAGSGQVKGSKSLNPPSGGANNGHVGSAANSGNPDATKKPQP